MKKKKKYKINYSSIVLVFDTWMFRANLEDQALVDSLNINF